MNNKTFRHFRKFISVFFLLLITGALTACGGKKAEAVDTTLGIDGYVYLPRQLSGSASSDFVVFGDYLYYYMNSTIFRVDMVSETNDEGLSQTAPDFSTKKSLAHISSSSIPNKTAEYPAESDEPVYNDMRDRILDTGKSRYSFYMSSYYAVDAEQNLYYYVNASAGEQVFGESGSFFMDMESIGGMLYKQAPDGQILYSLFLPSVNGLAADARQRLYVLTEEGIQILDASGHRINTVNIDQYIEKNSLGTITGRLLASPQGQVYYVANHNLSTTILEADDSDLSRMKEVSALTGKFINRISVCPNGSLMFFDSDYDMVYEYDRETSEVKEVFRWEDVNYHGDDFRQVVRLSPDRLLAEYWSDGTQSLFLLDKTSVDQLPEKELVVLASLSPTDEMRDAVIDFNRENSKYHVVIETYGSGLSDEDREPRLDATLVSSTPPDLLDLHDIYKYADQGALEDLTPYLEASDLVPLDDYLEPVLEGYTIDGRLVCVPTQFSISLVVGRASQLEEMGLKGGWTMEDAYALTEKYPDSIILHRLDNTGAMEKEEALNRFCSTWFLEKFVDWDTGTCSFDSDGFRRMLTWLDESSGVYADIPPDPATGYYIVSSVYMPEDALLALQPLSDFKTDLVFLEYKFKEEIRLLGIPTVDGRNRGLIYIHDALSLTSNARNKEGAWAFLEYFLSKNKIRSGFNYLPTRKSQLEIMFSTAITPPPIDEVTGEYRLGSTRFYYGMPDEEMHTYYYTPERLAQELMTAIESSDFTPLPDEADKILDIVLEEMAGYYNGDKSIDEVIKIIQNRSQLLLDEHKK